MSDRYILFTNLDYIRMGDVRFFCQSLVLARSSFGTEEPQFRVRGFKTDGALEVFDLSIKSLEHTVKDTTHKRVIENEGYWKNGHRPYTQTTITLEDGRELVLSHSDSEFEIDVEEFDGPLPTWEALKRKVAKYWQAPAMPVAHYVEARIVRQVTEDNAPHRRGAMGLNRF
jgi:hypothetical protein